MFHLLRTEASRFALCSLAAHSLLLSQLRVQFEAKLRLEKRISIAHLRGAYCPAVTVVFGMRRSRGLRGLSSSRWPSANGVPFRFSLPSIVQLHRSIH